MASLRLDHLTAQSWSASLGTRSEIFTYVGDDLVIWVDEAGKVEAYTMEKSVFDEP
jgi:hypothetical protein